MNISLLNLELYVLNMKTRMPFRYGIAVMTALPCLFVRLTVEIDGQPVHGFSSDGLAPKWFTKDSAGLFSSKKACNLGSTMVI